MSQFVNNAYLKTTKDDAIITSKFESIIKQRNTKELKKFIRSVFIPPDHVLRQHLWRDILCHCYQVQMTPVDSAPNNDSSGQHLSTSNNTLSGAVKISLSLSSLTGNNMTVPFLDTSFCQSFMLNELGKVTVNKILAKVWHDHPDIIYAPLLYILTALLLHYLDEPSALFCIETLLANNSNCKVYYLQQSKRDWQVDCKMLQLLMPRHASKMSKYLKRDINDDSGTELMHWVSRILELPFLYIIRIMDCYLVEGFKIFYRVGIILMRATYRYSLQTADRFRRFNLATDLSNCVANIERILPLDQFMHQVFSIRFFSRREITKQIRYLYDNVQLLPIMEIPILSITPVDFSHVENTTEILTNEELVQLYQWLPQRIALCKIISLFNTNKDGTSLRNLYAHCAENEPTVLIIESQCNHLFGAYCSTSWEERKNNRQELVYFGNGETFLFSLRPQMRLYVWVGKSGKVVPPNCEWFMAGNNENLVVGRGNSGQAIKLDDNLNNGSSKRCETFDSPTLSAQEKFVARNVVVLGFEQS